MVHIGASEMAKRVAPSSPELAAFYSARAGWRNWGEERIRYRLAQKLAQTEPGHAVLDIGGRGGGIRKFLPQGIKDQGRSEEDTSELQSRPPLVCRLLLGKQKHELLA